MYINNFFKLTKELMVSEWKYRKSKRKLKNIHSKMTLTENKRGFFLFTVLFQTIQFSISMQFKYKYRLIVKNISISNYSVKSSSSNSANSV